jgi:hypothetical protein
MSDPSRAVELGRFGSIAAAELARAALAGSGIPARLVDEHTVGAHPMLTAALGGVGLEVRARDLEAARALLDGLASDAAEDGDAGAVEPSAASAQATDPADVVDPRAASARADVHRALGAAMLGMFVPLILPTLWSLRLAVRAAGSWGQLGATTRGALVFAIAIDGTVLATATYLLAQLLG